MSGTVITVAWAQSSVVDPILWLRGLTGGADPPAADRVVVSSSTTATSWAQIPTNAIAGGAVTSAKLAGLGDISFNAGGKISFFSENLLKILLIPTGAYGIGVDSNIAYIQTPSEVAFRNNAAGAGDYSMRYNTTTHAMTINGSTVWHAGNDGASSGLDADLLDGVQGSGYALVAAGVPLNAVVWFPTLANLTAAGASWTRHTAADGRLLVGAGTAGSPTMSNPQTFTEATNYGTDWGHTHGGVGLGVSGGTDGPSTTFSVQSGTGATVPGGSHGHTQSVMDVSGSTDAAVWLPGMRAGIWGRKI